MTIWFEINEWDGQIKERDVIKTTATRVWLRGRKWAPGVFQQRKMIKHLWFQTREEAEAAVEATRKFRLKMNKLQRRLDSARDAMPLNTGFKSQ